MSRKYFIEKADDEEIKKALNNKISDLHNNLTPERRLKYRLIEETWHALQKSKKRKASPEIASNTKCARVEIDFSIFNKSSEKDKCEFCDELCLKADRYKFSSVGLLDSRKENSILENREINIFSDKEKVQVKLTSYCVYDEVGHLCCFDNHLLENGVSLYAAGYVKPIHNENPDIKRGFPVEQIGPITCWWIAGFDGGEKAILGISTETADYYLLKPHENYEHFLTNMNQKIYMVKVVIEFLKEREEIEATYENLLYKLEITVPPPGFTSLSEENLLMYADFIYDLVVSYDSTADDNERLLVNTPCMKTLAKLNGIDFQERLKTIQHKKKDNWMKRNNTMTKVASTNLVDDVFESFFPEQMDKSLVYMNMLKPFSINLSRCETSIKHDDCVNYDSDNSDVDLTLTEEPSLKDFTLRDFSIVLHRIDVEKKVDPIPRDFTIKLNRIDILKKVEEKSFGTPFSVVLEMLNLEYDKKDEIFSKTRASNRISRPQKSCNYFSTWSGERIGIDGDKVYYKKVILSNCEVEAGNFVITGNYSVSKEGIGRVIALWDENTAEYCHIRWLINSRDTVLGETGNSQELFETYECEDIKLYNIIGVIGVETELKDDETYFYQKRYNSKSGRFEDLIEDPEDFKTCSTCVHSKRKLEEEVPKLDERLGLIENTDKYSYRVVRWRNNEFRLGTCVFLKPGTLFPTMTKAKGGKQLKLEKNNDILYPEKYRKNFSNHRIINETPEPFNIGCVLSIFSQKDVDSSINIRLLVRKFYRPQDTHLHEDVTKLMDLNLLFWSDEECEVNFDQVEGKCFVKNSSKLNMPVDLWSKEGPYRYHYKEGYDRKNDRFYEIEHEKTEISDKQSISKDKITDEIPIKWPQTRPLRSLDIFAGCGGLTEGLHQAGVAQCHWAIEKEESAAYAFRLNYPQATVFTDDCNELLKLIMSGEKKKNGQNLPQKGEVELLCGGPPCQGFSRLNRFNCRQYSCFKNSLVVSFLSYVDYFRPRYVLMENVRNFLFFKKNMILKLTLRCLLKMGYQCTFGVVQAGCYGVPQSRRRAIVLAAAPGEILPNFPEPTHAFPDLIGSLNIDSEKFFMNIKWTSSAPLRMITVFDAIGDLPEIANNDSLQWEMSYTKDPRTHFQCLARKSNDGGILRDHVCKQMNPLLEKRISLIPRVPGSDWRDLPNIVVKLADGTYTKKLIYSHHDSKNGKSKNGALRGVCSCATGKKCHPEYRQTDTIIPWCLPHTGNRNNQWSGLFGRIEWDKYFQTVITFPEPMGKQGKVLHPEQNRVVSVREVARSQGFNDSFRFFGNIGDRYRQIGNAVPPPLAVALGREILKAVIAVEKRKMSFN